MEWVRVVAFFLLFISISYTQQSCPDECPLFRSIDIDYAYGEGLVGGVAVERTSFVVQTVNDTCFNETISQGELTVQVTRERVGGSVPVSSTTVDNNDGTYTVDYDASVPGVYFISAQLGGTSIYGSPYRVSWIAPSFCPYYNVTPERFSQKPDPALQRCNYYPENACCMNSDISVTLGIDFEFLTSPDSPFSQSAECINDFETLACGLQCSPAQFIFLDRTPLNDTNTFRVCSYFADQLFDSCRSFIPDSSMSNANNSAQDFFNVYSVDDAWPITITDVDCFNGTHVSVEYPDSRVSGSGISEIVQITVAAGIEYTIDINAVDIWKNPRLTGSDLFEVSVNPSQGIQVDPIQDNGDGTYSLVFNSTQIGTYEISIVGENGDSVLRGPFHITVVPGAISALGGFTTAENVRTTLSLDEFPTNFTLIAYDFWGNRITHGGDEDFFRFSFTKDDLSVTVDPIIVDNCDGTYTVFYSLSQTGEYVLIVAGTDNGIVLNVTITVTEVPCERACVGGDCVNGDCICYECNYGDDCAFSSRSSQLIGPGLSTELKMGDPTYFLILPNNGNSTGQLNIKVSINSITGAPFDQSVAIVYDPQTGIYNVSYTPGATGLFILTVTIDDCQISGKFYPMMWIYPENPCPCDNVHSICVPIPGGDWECRCQPGWKLPTCSEPDLGLKGPIIFSDLGTAIIANFSVPTNQANMYGEDNCSKVINNITMFGKNPFCVWVTPSTLVIGLGEGATVEIGDNITLKSDVIAVADFPHIKFPDFLAQGNMSILTDTKVYPALNPVVPVPVIVAPSLMSHCADLVLDGSFSLGSGGRAMKYIWRVISGVNSGALQAWINSLSGPNQTVDKIVIPSDIISRIAQPGTEYTFTLEVINHFGYSGSGPAQYTTSISDDFVPTIYISPSYKTSKLVSISTKLEGTATTSGCASPFLGFRDELIYSWIQSSGDVKQVDVPTTNSPLAFLSAGLLDVNETYDWQLRVQHTTYPELIATAHASLEVIQTIPYVKIAGGRARFFPETSDPALNLDLLALTIDYDNLPGEFHFIWTCKNIEWDEDCFDSAAGSVYLIDSRNISIPTYELPIGQFEISVIAYKLGGLYSNDTIRVTTNGHGPAITSVLSGGKNNKNTIAHVDDLSLRGYVNRGSRSSQGVSSWSWETFDGPNLDIEDASTTDIHSPSLAIPAGVAGFNQTWSFLIVGANGRGSGFSLIDVNIDQRAIGGYCVVTVNDTKKLSGHEEAYADILKAECFNWEALYDSVPIRYRFFLVEPTGLTLLNTGFFENDHVFFTAPPGNNSLLVEISNQLGDATYYEAEFPVEFRNGVVNDKTAYELALWLYDFGVVPGIASSDDVAINQYLLHTLRALNHPEYSGVNDTYGSTDETIARKTKIRDSVVDTLLFDFDVEYDLAGIVQRLQILAGALGKGQEVSNDTALAAIALLQKLYNLSADASPTFGMFPEDQFVNATGQVLTNMINALKLGGLANDSAARKTIQPILLNLYDSLYTGMLADLVPGSGPKIFGTNPVAMIDALYLCDCQVPFVIELNGVRFEFPEEWVLDLASKLDYNPSATFYFVLKIFDRDNNIYITNETQISSPVAELEFYYNGQKINYTQSTHYKVTLPYDNPQNKKRQNVVSVEELQTVCHTYENDAFTGDSCVLDSVTDGHVVCNCTSVAPLAGFTVVTTGEYTEGPGPVDPNPQAKEAEEDDFMTDDMIVVLVILVAIAVVLLIAGVLAFMYRRHKSDENQELAVLHSRWEAEEEWRYQRKKQSDEEMDEVIEAVHSVEEEDEEIISDFEHDQDHEEGYKSRTSSRLSRMAHDKITDRGMHGSTDTRRGRVDMSISAGPRRVEEEPDIAAAVASPRSSMRAVSGVQASSSRTVVVTGGSNLGVSGGK